MGEIARNERGHYLPGSGGRPHGAKNKARRELQKFVETNLATLQKEYDTLEPKDKLRFLQSVMAFVIPRLQAETDSDGNTLEQKASIDYSKLSPELLHELLNNTTLNTSEDGTETE